MPSAPEALALQIDGVLAIRAEIEATLAVSPCPIVR